MLLMRTRLGTIAALCTLMIGFAESGHSQQLWSGIIAPARAVDWSHAGVVGGIPSSSWKPCGATIPAGSSAETINRAIADCKPSRPYQTGGRYVLLAKGMFGLSTGLILKSGVALRGMGADQTFLIFSHNNGCQGPGADICFESTDANWKREPSNGPVDITGNLGSGSTTITLTRVPNLRVGNPIILDQADDTCDSGGVLVTDLTTSCTAIAPGVNGPYSLQANRGGDNRAERNQMQFVLVTSCGRVRSPGELCSGTNVSVGISPGLYMPNWSSAKTPQAWWATNPISWTGVEDLSIDNSAVVTPGITFFNAFNGWVKGVRDIASQRAHVHVESSALVSIVDSYFFLTQNSQSQSYGFECYGGSDLLVENNIFQGVSSPLIINSACSGTVLGYNFDINNFYTGSAGYINAMSNLHAPSGMILFEGNIGPQIYGDVFHGTSNFVTIFRNYLIGNQPACWLSGSAYNTAAFGNCNNDQTPLQILSFQRFHNVVGNVLGQPGIQKTYVGTGSRSVYILGEGNGLNRDPNVSRTLLRWANYDVISQATRFCGKSSDSGWSTICGGNTEVPINLAGVQAPYSNPVPSYGDTGAGQAPLVASFYHSSKPSWWPSSKPWPSIGPDVTGGNVSGVGGHVYTIPAEDCFINVMRGNSSGTGGPYSFNDSMCYGSAIQGNPPNPPTGVKVVVD
jgi:hypothetical protein